MATTKKEANAEVEARRVVNHEIMLRNRVLVPSQGGYPVYFYCRHCELVTGALGGPADYCPEPRTICSKCKELEEKGLLS